MSNAQLKHRRDYTQESRPSGPSGASDDPGPSSRSPADTASISWGLLLAVGLAVAAYGLRSLPWLSGFSLYILAMCLGMAVRNTIDAPGRCQPGISFTLKRLLRIGIVFLGLQISLDKVLEIGAPGLIVVIASLVGTFVFVVWAGKLLNVDRKLSELVAAGTSICGASAVLATNTVTRASEEDAAYSVALVTVYGALSMLVYPLLLSASQLTPQQFGLWAGASIHETAQVVAVAFQAGELSGQLGTISKLSRVMLLAPMVLLLAALAASKARRSTDSSSIPIPWFLFGFIGMAAFNSFHLLPPASTGSIVLANQFLLTIAMAAMGLETRFSKLRAKGLRPLLLGAIAWIFISLLSYLMIKFAC